MADHHAAYNLVPKDTVIRISISEVDDEVDVSVENSTIGRVTYKVFGGSQDDRTYTIDTDTMIHIDLLNTGGGRYWAHILIKDEDGNLSFKDCNVTPNGSSFPPKPALVWNGDFRFRVK